MALDHEGKVCTGMPSGIKEVASGHPAFDTYNGLPPEPAPVSSSDIRITDAELSERYDARMQEIIDSGEISAETLIAEAHKRD